MAWVNLTLIFKYSHLVHVWKGSVTYFKPNALSPHCPCSGPSGCCWAAPGYFSSHHEARQPYWPALRSAPSASWVTIYHGTLRKQNDVWEICHHLNYVRLLTSAAGDSFTHRALTDTLIIKKKEEKKKQPKDLTARQQDINQGLLTCPLICPPHSQHINQQG